MPRFHFGEFDHLFPEDLSLVRGVERQNRGEVAKLEVSTSQTSSTIRRLERGETEFDLLEIEHFLKSYRGEAMSLRQWIATQNPDSKNTLGEPIGPELRRLSRLSRRISAHCRRIEIALLVGDTAGAALLGLKTATLVAQKRYLVDYARILGAGNGALEGAARGGMSRVASPGHRHYLSRLDAEAKRLRAVEPSISDRRIANELCKPGGVAHPRKPETVRKQLAKINGAVPAK